MTTAAPPHHRDAGLHATDRSEQIDLDQTADFIGCFEAIGTVSIEQAGIDNQ